MSEELKMPRTHDELATVMRKLLREMKEAGLGMGMDDGSDKTKNLAYYTEANGKAIKEVIDVLMSNRKPILFNYSDYPKLRPATLYNKINQAIRYLVDKLDTPDGYYTNIWENNLELTTKVMESGLVLRYVEATVSDKPFVVQQLDIQAASGVWKNELDNWLMTSLPGDKWMKEGIGLSEEQIAELKEELSSLAGVIHVVTSNKIIVAKRPEDKPEPLV